MKRIISLCLVLSFALGLSFAQLPPNPTRNVLATVDENEIVRPGEFQMELMKGALFNDETENPWFSFVYTTMNRFTGNCNVFVNEAKKFIDKTVSVRTFKIAPTFDKCVFVIKNMGAPVSDMGSGMEVIVANGIVHTACDSVLDVTDEGYVYALNGITFYSLYKADVLDRPGSIPVVWMNKRVYNPDRKPRFQEQTEALSRLSGGDIYYESSDGHFYYVFRDKYMPFSLLVVDNEVVELFDVYNEDNFQLKFSYDGKHWMAVGHECYWVDGKIRSVEGYVISDFVIGNDGHYAYKAFKKEASETSEVVVVDGKIIRQNARVSYFSLNDDGKLKFRFVSGGRILQYEDGEVVDVTDELVSTYFPDNRLNGETVMVLSSDGSHKMTYKTDTPSVVIDGVKVAKSAPCFALYDDRNNAFIWNAIEENKGKTELVIYKYTVSNNFFKKLFN